MRWIGNIFLALIMMSCQSGDDVLNILAESGVSKELAAFRSEKY